MSIERSSMSGGTRGRSFTGLFAPPKCAASGRVIQAGCQLWMIKIIGSPTRPCSGWPLPFMANSPRGSAWCSTSRKAETPRRKLVLARPWRNWPFRGVTLHAVHCLASPLGANNDDVILKAIVLVYIRHHWIEKRPSRRTELPAWGLPAMSRRVWAVWRTVASPRHVRIVLYNPCSCCYSMLRSVDTWTGDLFRKPLADVDL